MPKITKMNPVKYGRTGSKTLYNFLDVTLSTLLFVLVYYFWLNDDPFSFQLILYIFLLGLISGLVGSMIARTIANYWVIGKNAQSFLTSILNAFTYAIVLAIGFMTLLLSSFNLSTPMGMIQFIVVLIFIKMFIFFMSDYFADRMLFQGGN